MKFWSNAYSRKRTSGHNGTLWSDKSRKYIYGIRHMYGLEGGRVDYPAKSCNCIKNNKGSYDDLHCNIIEDIEDLLKNREEAEKSKIRALREVGRVSEACGSAMGL